MAKNQTNLELVSRSGLPWIGVTGSNGKSTTAKWLQLMLRAGDIKTFLGGGAFRNVFETAEAYDTAVLELSHRVLARAGDLKPRIAIVTNLMKPFEKNITNSESERRFSKLFLKQGPDDFVVYNAENRLEVELVMKAPGRHIRIYLKNPAVYSSENFDCAYFEKDTLYFRREEVESYPLDQVKMRGKNNYLNALCALVAARLSGVAPEKVQAVLESFAGLPHRMQPYVSTGDFNFYDDSRSSNPAATAWGLTRFQNSVVLIMGGADGDRDYRPLLNFIKNKVKLLLLCGPARKRIYEVLKDQTETYLVASLEEAVSLAKKKALVGGDIVYSPAAAPETPAFSGYLDRGRKFLGILRRESSKAGL